MNSGIYTWGYTDHRREGLIEIQIAYYEDVSSFFVLRTNFACCMDGFKMAWLAKICPVSEAEEARDERNRFARIRMFTVRKALDVT